MSVKNGIVLMHRSPRTDFDGDGRNEMYLQILMHGGEIESSGALGPVRVEQNFNRPNDGIVKSHGAANDFPAPRSGAFRGRSITPLGPVLTDPDEPLIFGPATRQPLPAGGHAFPLPDRAGRADPRGVRRTDRHADAGRADRVRHRRHQGRRGLRRHAEHAAYGLFEIHKQWVPKWRSTRHRIPPSCLKKPFTDAHAPMRENTAAADRGPLSASPAPADIHGRSALLDGGRGVEATADRQGSVADGRCRRGRWGHRRCLSRLLASEGWYARPTAGGTGTGLRRDRTQRRPVPARLVGARRSGSGRIHPRRRRHRCRLQHGGSFGADEVARDVVAHHRRGRKAPSQCSASGST